MITLSKLLRPLKKYVPVSWVGTVPVSRFFFVVFCCFCFVVVVVVVFLGGVYLFVWCLLGLFWGLGFFIFKLNQ